MLTVENLRHGETMIIEYQENECQPRVPASPSAAEGLKNVNK